MSASSLCAEAACLTVLGPVRCARGRRRERAALGCEPPDAPSAHRAALCCAADNFSDELAQLLCGTGIPSYITGLPAEVLATPFGQMIRPMLDGLEVQLRSMRSQSWHQQVDAAAAEAEAAATVASAGEGPALLAAEKEIEAAMAAGMMQEAEAAGATTTTEGGAADNARLAAERAVSAAFQRVMAGGNVGEHDAQALAMEAVAAWQKQQQQAGSE